MIQLFSGVVALGTALSMGYCALSIWSATRFLLRRTPTSPEASSLPPVSILKPLKGADLEMYECLRSHCVFNYEQYELVFGVNDPNDPAVAVVERLVHEFPNHDIRLLHCETVLGANGKVSALAQMAKLAKHGFLLVNDSDIRVQPEYLRTVITELQRPNIGLVTCLYRGVRAGTLPSRLESLGLSTDFAAGVLVARQLEGGLRFGLGSTLALRKSDLEAIGGFESIVDYLADDYELGRRIAERNLKVELSESIVETFLPAYDFPGFLAHQLRWARTIRTSRPAGYAGLLLTLTLPWATLTVLVARGATWSWEIFAAALLARVAMAVVTGRLVLQDKEVLRSLWCLPVRDFVAFGVWLAGLAGNTVWWRGELFKLRNGKLRKL
jgi:ceramide glucosyltransferase